MPTLKSRRGIAPGRWDRYNTTPGSHARRKAARLAASIAGPAPCYPATAPTAGEWWGGCINGQTVIASLIRDPGHRCDQWRVEIDGVIVAQAMGLVDLCVLLRGRFGRAPSRRMLAGLQEGYSARDEAATAGAWAGD